MKDIRYRKKFYSEGIMDNKDYLILGKKYRAKPLKLQLNKNSYTLIREITEFIKTEAELNDDELKNPDYSAIISLAITGFLSSPDNCSRVLGTFIDSDEDWGKIIDDNKEKRELFKTISMKILNDFFLNVLKLTGKSNN